MNRTWILLTSIGLAAAIPNVTFAVDGVVLINQANALAGNVTPGDTPGFPVTISVSGSYRLSSNLTVPDVNTDGIDITADNVTIDLNGFSILGPVVCSGTTTVTSCSPQGIGMGVSSFNVNTAVLNGAIKGMGLGIVLRAAARVEKVQISSSSGIGIVGFDGSEISSSVVTFNGAEGIIMGAGVVSGSIASFNHGNGIEAMSGATLISGNNTSVNGGAGILVRCVSLVTGNTAVANAGGSIVTQQPGCVLANNAP
jgi:hypothetical protein